MTDLVVLAPLRLEAAAVRRGAPGARVVRTGMGARAARRAAARPLAGDRIAIAGVCGALDPGLEPGDVVVASEVRGPTGTQTLDGAAELAERLRARGLRVRHGPIVTAEHIVTGAAREAAAADGALAVDLESALLAPAAAGRPLAVVRVVLDTPSSELRNPLATVRGTVLALRSLRRAAGALEEWSVQDLRDKPTTGRV